MEILVVGAGCASCDKVYADTREAVKELGLAAEVRKVEDLGGRWSVWGSCPSLLWSWTGGRYLQDGPSAKTRSKRCWNRK